MGINMPNVLFVLNISNQLVLLICYFFIFFFAWDIPHFDISLSLSLSFHSSFLWLFISRVKSVVRFYHLLQWNDMPRVWHYIKIHTARLYCLKSETYKTWNFILFYILNCQRALVLTRKRQQEGGKKPTCIWCGHAAIASPFLLVIWIWDTYMLLASFSSSKDWN